MMRYSAIISALAAYASASLTRSDCVETNSITLSASNIYSTYGPSNFTCARGISDAGTNTSILTLTLAQDLMPYRDTMEIQLILFNANGQTDYWDPSNTNAIPDFFVLAPNVDYSEQFGVPSQRIDFDSWGYDVQVRANQLDENDVIQNPIHSHATQIDDWCVGTYSIVFDMNNIAQLQDDAFEWHLAARLNPRNQTYLGGYSELYGNGRIGYNVESEDDGETYLDSSPRLYANKTVSVEGYTRPGQSICIPIGENFAAMGLPPKTIEITIEADTTIMRQPNVTAIGNDEISDFWRVRIPGYDPAAAATGSYLALEDEEFKYHYDNAGKIRFRLPRVSYDNTDDGPEDTIYPSCVDVTVPGGQVFEDETTAFPSADGTYPFALGVFIDFQITITGLEYYPVLFDFRTDGEFGTSDMINNVTVDRRASLNGDWVDREGIFVVYYEADLFTNFSIVLSNAQINEGAHAMYSRYPPSSAFRIRYQAVTRDGDVTPYSNNGNIPPNEFPGTYSIYNGDFISSYTYSGSLNGLSGTFLRSPSVDIVGRALARGSSRVGAWLVVVDRGVDCDAAYMQTSVHAVHDRIQGECIHSDDCIREKSHPSEGRADVSANEDENRMVACADVPTYDMSKGGRVLPRTRCIECGSNDMCHDGQYCQLDAGICNNNMGEYVCDGWAHRTYGTCQEKESRDKKIFGKICNPTVSGTIYGQGSTLGLGSVDNIPREGGRGGDTYAPNGGFCGDARFWNSTGVEDAPGIDVVPRQGYARSILWQGVCLQGICLECNPDFTITSADDRFDRASVNIPTGKHCVNGRIVSTTIVDNTHNTLAENVPLQIGIALFTFFLFFLVLFCFSMVNATNSHRELYGEEPMSCLQWLWYVFCPWSCCCASPARIGTGVQTSGATGKPTQHKAARVDRSDANTSSGTTTSKPSANPGPVPAAGPGFSSTQGGTMV